MVVAAGEGKETMKQISFFGELVVVVAAGKGMTEELVVQRQDRLRRTELLATLVAPEPVAGHLQAGLMGTTEAAAV